MAGRRPVPAEGRAAAEEAMAAARLYVVQSDLLHNGTPCIPGDTVPGAMFTDDQRAHLTACGTLTPIEPEPASAGGNPPPE